MPDLLIPRAHLFGNPSRLAGTISPDGASLAWVAPFDGVLNVWVAPVNEPGGARAVTSDTARGIRDYLWSHDGRHIVFLKDNEGDENWRVHAVDLKTGEIRPPRRKAHAPRWPASAGGGAARCSPRSISAIPATPTCSASRSQPAE